ncbi:16S rRNA (cytidine(1402)-2'-O)-methyltransferase [bacterium]|nr:16S rRNA (cytidine(1402)-2'-O)-methyltransferase [bacterium]MBU1984686.1 16S rRNA (cytidine(1402)-2'-O)-methyltransferase [bacterium]
MSGNHEAGALVLVATPIGNLADVSQRALSELAGADVILCEDTRHSAKLLTHYGIHVPTTSYGSHNLRAKIPWIMEQLRNGRRLALICDAGMPGISDPGAVLVRAVLDEGLAVEAIPGPNALLLALVLSGLPTDRFIFDGFLPHKKGRQTRLRELANEPRTIVLYESPHRLLKTLTELHERLGDRQSAVARELTKLYEEVRRGRLSEHIEHFTKTPPRGEFVLIVAGTDYREKAVSS